MTKELKSVLNPKEGYMIIPRQLAKSIIDQVNIEDAAKLYYYLLLSANYAATKNNLPIAPRIQFHLFRKHFGLFEKDQHLSEKDRSV